LQSEHASAADDAEARDGAQRENDFFGNTVAKIFLLRIGTLIVKGEDSNGLGAQVGGPSLAFIPLTLISMLRDRIGDHRNIAARLEGDRNMVPAPFVGVILF